MMTKGGVLLSVSLMAAGTKVNPNENLTCKKGYDLSKMENRMINNEFCLGHVKRTCCGKKDVNKAMALVDSLARNVEWTNEECLNELTNVACAPCDPDMVSN
jgi:hypothetical protein